MKERNIGLALYFKPGYALTLLREQILGVDRFDYRVQQIYARLGIQTSNALGLLP